MLDFTKLFTDAFNTIRKNPVTLFPLSLAILFTLMISGGFIIVSGISEPLQLYMQAVDEYDALKTSYILDASNTKDERYLAELATYTARETELSLDDQSYHEGLNSYINQNYPGLNEHIDAIVFGNVGWIALLGLISLLAMIYATCAMYASIAQALRKKTDFMTLATSKFFPWIGLSILISLITVIPFAILAALALSVFLLVTNTELSLISLAILALVLVLAVLAAIGLIAYLCFRLFLAQVALFNGHGVFSSITESFKLTKPKTPHFSSALIAFLVIIATSSFAGSIFSGAVAAFGQQIIIPTNPLDMIVGFILFIPFAAAFIFTSAFILSLTFHIYAHLARR